MRLEWFIHDIDAHRGDWTASAGLECSLPFNEVVHDVLAPASGVELLAQVNGLFRELKFLTNFPRNLVQDGLDDVSVSLSRPQLRLRSVGLESRVIGIVLKLIGLFRNGNL